MLATPETIVDAATERLSAVNLSIETISPDLAATWLARGGKNRKLNEKRVDVLVAAIRRGEWCLTGDAVKLDSHGRVRDGQHRLRAIVKSGVPLESVVIRNVDEKAFDVMDSGRSRTAGDVLGIHGYASFNALASAARLCMMMERFGRPQPTIREAQTVISNASILRYVTDHPDLTNGVRLGDTVRTSGLQGGAGLWGGLMTMFLRNNAEAAYQFAHYLKTGEDMAAGHPALILRNRLMWKRVGDAKYSKGGVDREEIAALVIKSWNAFRAGRTIQTLYFRNDGPKAEDFPKVAA